MARYGGNGEYQPIKLNTNGITFFTEKENSAAMRTSYYSEDFIFRLMITFMEPVVDPSTGKRTYPQDRRLTASLDHQRALDFEDIITNKFMPDYMAEKVCCYGVFTNNRCDSLIQIGLDLKKNVFVAFSVGIDENKKANKTLICTFDKTLRVSDYKPETGEIGTVEEFDGPFFLFYRLLRGFNDISIGAYSAAARSGNGWSLNTIMERVNQLALKLGVVTPEQLGGLNGSPRSSFINSINNKAHSTVTTVSYMEDELNENNNPYTIEEKTIDELSDILANNDHTKG